MLGMALLLGLLCWDGKALAQPMTGSVNQDGWTFTWDATSTSGVRILNVNRNGVKYLHNGSLPSLRVQYDGNACGPYLDRIKWSNMVADGAGNKVRVQTFASWIRVWVQAQIDQYTLQQSWWFSRGAGTEGRLIPEIGSSGLQCVVNHRHHPYWRFDFDASTAGGNRSWTVKNGVYTQRFNEFNTTKSSAGPDIVIANIADPTRFINLKPGGADGTPDSFANWDYAGRLFPSLQNDPYLASNPNTFADPGDLEAAGNPSSSNNGEAIDNADVVYWYSAHLPHIAANGAAQMNFVGPDIRMVDN
jgi:hypothetical protein